MSKIDLNLEMQHKLASAMKLMGYDNLWPEQEESVYRNIAGQETLTLLATGGGKTACFVIPGLVRSHITLVISPLRALQRDQVDALRQRGISAYLYNGDISDERKGEIVNELCDMREAKKPAFLFAGPESVLTERFLKHFGEHFFHRMAIDEVHCVSTWGNSFRPDYQRLGAIAQRLKIPVCSAYTATVTAKVLADIFRYTPLEKKTCRKISGESVRYNLHLSMVDMRNIEGNRI